MGKSSRVIFSVEKVPGNVKKGLGWIQIVDKLTQKYNIPHGCQKEEK